MVDEKKNPKKELKMSIRFLAVLAATKHGAIFNVSQGPEQVLAMLKWAASSKDTEVNKLFMAIGENLTSAHTRFFESNGVVFTLLPEEVPQTRTMTYRGKSILNAAVSKDEPSAKRASEDDDNKGKRKITYRGQEKWV